MISAFTVQRKSLVAMEMFAPVQIITLTAIVTLSILISIAFSFSVLFFVVDTNDQVKNVYRLLGTIVSNAEARDERKSARA